MAPEVGGGSGGSSGIAPISSSLTRTALRLKEPEAFQACSPALKLTGILIIIITKLREVEGGLDHRVLVLVVGLKGFKRLSRLSPEREGHPLLSRPPRLGFRLLWWGNRAIFPIFPSSRTRQFNSLLFRVPLYLTR